MTALDKKRTFSQRLTDKLPLLVVLFCCIQPVLDVLGYWQDELGIPNVLTLTLRMLLLAGTVLAGFLLSDRKRYYWIAAGVLGLLTLGHGIACLQVGYPDPMQDLINLVRIYLMPMTAICFITFLRRNEKVFPAIKLGLALTMGIFILVMAVSELTGTNPYTYPNKKLGILGWFMWTNSQSAILSMLMPISIAWALSRWKTKLLPVLLVTAVAEVALFFLAPRLAYASLVAIGLGLSVSLLLAREKRGLRQAVAIFLCTAVFVGLYPVSPTRLNQLEISKNAAERQQAVDEIMNEATKPTKPTEPPQPGVPEPEPEPPQELTYLEKMDEIYSGYLGGLVRRFGLERVLKAYDFSTDTGYIANNRTKKIMFCKLLMEDSPRLSRWFGLDIGRMFLESKVKDPDTLQWVDGYEVYDVENDFHGIYFLCGGVGLALMLGFLMWFALRVLLALVRRFRTAFTVDLAAFCAAYCTAMLHCYFTASILRRNNASVYLAMILAGMWYLTRREQALPAEGDDPCA